MIDRAISTIKKYNMLSKDCSVMVCVSGGADSMALLHFMQLNKTKLCIKELYACHFNHGLRGNESDKEQALVERYCIENDIELIVGFGDMKAREMPKGEGTESWARALRYEFFNNCLKKNGDLIATAHNRDDQAETLLLNLIRGSGIRGARGIAPKNKNIIRPFIELSRSEIEEYCCENKIPFLTDSSNLTDRYSRNKIRHNVVPALREINASAPKNLAAFCERASQLYSYIEKQAHEAIEKGKREDGSYQVEPFLELDEVVLNTALALLLEKHTDVDPSAELLERLARGLGVEKNKMQICGDIFFVVSGGVFEFKKKEYDYGYERDFEFGELKLNNAFCVSVELLTQQQLQKLSKSSKSVYINSMDCGKIIGNLHFRSRQESDSFRSLTRKNTKSLKKLMNEMNVPRHLRLRYPVLADEAGVVWVLGEGVCERVAISETTRRAAYIQSCKGEIGDA